MFINLILLVKQIILKVVIRMGEYFVDLKDFKVNIAKIVELQLCELQMINLQQEVLLILKLILYQLDCPN